MHPHHQHRQSKVEKRRVAHLTKHYASGGSVHSDEAADKKLIKKTVKRSALKVDGHKPKHRADHRARGGRTKHKGTNVNVIVAGGAHPQAPMAAPPAAPAGLPIAAARPALPPQAMPQAGAPAMPPGQMPMHKRGGRTYASGGAVKDGPAWKEGLRDGTQVQHAPGKDDLKDLNRGKPVTYKSGGRIVKFNTGGGVPVKFRAYGGKIEAPQGVESTSKLPGGSGGGEARLKKARTAKHGMAL